MSGCCDANGLESGQRGVCPSCGQKPKPVATVTVKNLVVEHTRVQSGLSFYSCRTADCDIVYFSDKTVFRKPDVKVRVGFKETEDPIPLCYCFGYDRKQITQDIEQRGSSEIPERIKAEVQGRFCACEVKNPGGSCCLGDINRAVKEAYEAFGVRS